MAWAPEGRILVSADSECVRFSNVHTTSVFDEFRPGWVIESARLGNPPSGPPVLVLAGDVNPPGIAPPTGRVAIATFAPDASTRPAAD